MAAVAAAHLPALYPNVTAYTYGEPRSGNAEFAAFIDKAFNTSSIDTTRFFRVTHEDDGIVKVPSTDGFVHHALELWTRDPVDAANTYICGGDTNDCAGSTGASGGINNAHNSYFGSRPGNCVVQ